MGCSCSRDESIITINKSLKKNKFVIKINLPYNDKIKVLILENNSEFMLMSELVNKSIYAGNNSHELDANFISLYDKDKDEFKYYIQRLAGIEIENEENPKLGKVWVAYINNQAQDWSVLCHENRIIKKDDEIELKYELLMNENSL